MPIRPAHGNAADRRDNLAAVILLAWAMLRPFNLDPHYLVEQWRGLKDRIDE